MKVLGTAATLVLGAVLMSACAPESEQSQARHIYERERAFAQRAKSIVHGAIVIKRADGICVLYTETRIGAVGWFPLISSVTCPATTK